jgi:HAD superfamily hydrolase (TIGR01549 family)
MQPAITFDFHNTLIHCDPWFDLEVTELPGEVARTLVDAGHASFDADHRTEMTAVYRALRAVIIAHGNELDATAGVLETFQRMGYVADQRLVESVVDELFRPLVAETELVPGVRDTVAYLADAGYVLGVVSSAVHHDFLEWSLTHHGIRPYFADVVTSASVGFYKSRPEIYRIACGRLGSAPGQTIHVGDSFRFDHLGGSAAGLRTVWLNRKGIEPAPAGPRPELELPTLVGAGPRIAALLENPAVNAR